MQSFKTPKGTILPLLDLRGKPYLQVAHRIVWFREEHPDYRIETTVEHGNGWALARCFIYDDKNICLATSHKTETKSDFKDFVEKAETGAIGRALAFVGYGTQFCADELNEGERLADSPITTAKTNSSSRQVSSSMAKGASRIGGQDFKRDDYKTWVFPPKKDGTQGKYTGMSIAECVEADGLEQFEGYVKRFYKSAQPRLEAYLADHGHKDETIMDHIRETKPPEPDWNNEPPFDPAEEIPF